MNQSRTCTSGCGYSTVQEVFNPFCGLINTSRMFWDFNGNYLDLKGGNDGISTNVPLVSTPGGGGGIEPAYNQNGYVDVGNFDVAWPELSVVTWFKVDNVSNLTNASQGGDRFITKTSSTDPKDATFSFGIYLNSTGFVEYIFIVNGSVVPGSTTKINEGAENDPNLYLGGYAFAAGTYNGTAGIMRLYEGNPVTEDVVLFEDRGISGGPVQPSIDQMRIANYPPAGPYGEYNGTIDDILIFDRALNESELNILYDHYRIRTYGP